SELALEGAVRPAPAGCLDRLLAARRDADVELPILRLALPAGPLERLHDVGVGRGRDQRVAEPACELRGVLGRGRDRDRRRLVGQVTPVRIGIRSVASAIAPRTLQTNGLSPCSSSHGWKWSEIRANSNPEASAIRAWATSSCGVRSSEERAYPIDVLMRPGR